MLRGPKLSHQLQSTSQLKVQDIQISVNSRLITSMYSRSKWCDVFSKSINLTLCPSIVIVYELSIEACKKLHQRERHVG